jgi:uncharacterized protein YndB with AHSA1/START domain
MTKLSIVAKGDCELVITRMFAAPPRLVFEAHTVPALMKRWLTGPDGWALAQCDIDLRAGGAYAYRWRHQDGREMGMSGAFREVEAPHRLVGTEIFDDDWTGGEAVFVQTFEAAGKGQTLLTTTTLYSSREARDGAHGSGMETGVAASYARLDTLLAGAPIDADA